MKNQIKILITFFICLVFFSCASSQKVQNQEDVKAPKKKKAEVQESKKESKLYNPERSEKIVKQSIDKVSPAIKEALTEVISVYDQKSTVSLKLYITPGGALDFIGFVDSVKLDSTALKDLSESLNMQVLDKTDKRTFAKVIVRSYLDENKAVALSDDIEIDYVEIRALSAILIIVNMNSRNIIRAYSKRWAEKPDLEGRITVKFGIDEHGNVVSCNIISSTINDAPLEEVVIKNVMSWKFGEIYNPGDVTEVVYPFNFTQ